MGTNEELLTTSKIRTENHNEIQRILIEINQILYNAQRLRGNFKIFMHFFGEVSILMSSENFLVGAVATKMMASYKESLASKNIEKIIQIMEISG